MTLMTHFLVASCLCLHDEPLLLPVLQHLTNGVARDVGTLHADTVLEGTIKAEFHIQALKDRVVLTHALAVVRSAIFAAIESGLTPDTAYTVGDSYIQSLTECKTIADVRTVNHSMYEDFIQRVHRQRYNPQYSRQIQSCAAYIEAHLDEKLTLEQLSRQVGYSEYHLSRKFKDIIEDAELPNIRLHDLRHIASFLILPR